MSDSPKCINCLNAGKTGQTYKIAGRQQYVCSDCKTSYPASTFTPIEYMWKDDKPAWLSYMRSRGVNVT